MHTTHLEECEICGGFVPRETLSAEGPFGEAFCQECCAELARQEEEQRAKIEASRGGRIRESEIGFSFDECGALVLRIRDQHFTLSDEAEAWLESQFAPAPQRGPCHNTLPEPFKS